MLDDTERKLILVAELVDKVTDILCGEELSVVMSVLASVTIEVIVNGYGDNNSVDRAKHFGNALVMKVEAMGRGENMTRYDSGKE